MFFLTSTKAKLRNSKTNSYSLGYLDIFVFRLVRKVAYPRGVAGYLPTLAPILAYRFKRRRSQIPATVAISYLLTQMRKITAMAPLQCLKGKDANIYKVSKRFCAENGK